MAPSAEVIRVDLDCIAQDATAVLDQLDPAAHRLLAEVPLRSRVLDIGCGVGTFARELASKRGARVTAIDSAPHNIEIARTHTRATLGIDYRVADFMELSPRGFDVVVAIDALDTLPVTAPQRIASAVLPGGQVLIAGRARQCGIVWWLLGRPVADVRAVLRAAMPGVRVRRHLGGRYTAIWRKPR